MSRKVGVQLIAVLVVSLLSVTALSQTAPPSVQIRVAETYPADREDFHANENFYLRIAYTTDRPVRIYARPFFRGEAASTGDGPLTHPAQLLTPGSGETLGWFTYRSYANVDDVRITAVPDGARDTIASASYPVTLYWDDSRAVPASAPPAWVAQLNAAQQQAVAYRPPADEQDSLLGGTIVVALFGVIAAALAWTVWAFRRWRGRWRLVAGLPLAVFGIWTFVLLASWTVDPTSHNLWPFELLMWAAATLIYLCVAGVARLIARPGTETEVRQEAP